MNRGDRGYVTLATGRPDFLELAVDLALSLRERSDLPVALVTDEALEPVVGRRFDGIFDAVTLLPARFREGRARKFGVPEATPWQRAVYLDADSIALGRLDGYFDPLEGTPLGVLGETLTERDLPAEHHGFSVGGLMERFGIDRYLKTNSGILYFERPAALPLMDACLSCYRDEILRELRWGYHGDELAIGVVGVRRGLEPAFEPGPMLWPREIARIDLAEPTRPLLHLIGPLPDVAFRELLEAIEKRRRAAGVECTSTAIWRREHRSVFWQHALRRLWKKSWRWIPGR